MRVLLGLALAAVLTGCVERRIQVTSEPSGALVWINDHEVGRTPVETTFKYHGAYDVRLELEGYEPLVTRADAVAPWYEYPGPDLAAEVLPFMVRNTQHWHFELEESAERRLSPAELEAELLERAGELRGRAAQ